ncbi:hypothetical protein F4U96_06205 [Sphingobium limneticum]|uniref:Uncharacterized protein n=1 Tax=Sphingobium limneticum TaxID=1007511 RepID=A0A5J5I8L1_9SPHN|nr:hypothetical protein F4U96_06205 [Sphingobium limneticum]KAA9032364.1 hypothetical protein F4U95_06205 [Sphingobium limneticum]
MIPIERAARALSKLDSNSEDGWQDCIPQTLAVLEAFHEPSQPMREAGAEIFRVVQPDHSEAAAEDDAATVWRLMIDAMRTGVDKD